MKKHFTYHGFCSAGFVVVTFLALPQCVASESKEAIRVTEQEGAGTTGEGAINLRELREAWRTRCGRLEGNRFELYGKRITELQGMLDERIDADRSSQLAKLPEQARQEYDLDLRFVACLRQAAVALLVKRGESKELASLLAEACPRHIYYLPTEVYVCLPHRNNGLKEGICVLFDAYRLCKDAKNRRVIARVVRDGFEGVVGRIEEDDAFVEGAEKWYTENRARLVYNRSYAGEKHRGASLLPPILIPVNQSDIEKGAEKGITSSL